MHQPLQSRTRGKSNVIPVSDYRFALRSFETQPKQPAKPTGDTGNGNRHTQRRRDKGNVNYYENIPVFPDPSQMPQEQSLSPIQAKMRDSIREEQARRVRPVGPGRPIHPEIRQRMESAFGADFSDVRIHQGTQASELGALAYTQGRDIHFAPGQYNPLSNKGQRVLGHELTHVMQQRSGKVALPKGPGLPINDDSNLEGEADRLGAKAAQGGPINLKSMQSRVRHNSVVSDPVPLQLCRECGFNPEVHPDPQTCPFNAKNRPRKSLSDRAGGRRRKKSQKSEAAAASRVQKAEKRRKQRRAKLAAAEYRRRMRDAPPTATENITVTNTKGDSTPQESTLINKERMQANYGAAMGGGLEPSYFHVRQRPGTLPQHFSLRQGHDYAAYALKPAEDRPGEFQQDTREGPAYVDVAKNADAAALHLMGTAANPNYPDIESARQRVGRDINKMAGGRDAKELYPSEHFHGKHGLGSFAAIHRADKGRVPGATGYMDETLRSHESSFTDRYGGRNPTYVGTGSGTLNIGEDEGRVNRGPTALRRMAELQPGDESDYGSDGEMGGGGAAPTEDLGGLAATATGVYGDYGIGGAAAAASGADDLAVAVAAAPEVEYDEDMGDGGSDSAPAQGTDALAVTVAARAAAIPRRMARRSKQASSRQRVRDSESSSDGGESGALAGGGGANLDVKTKRKRQTLRSDESESSDRGDGSDVTKSQKPVRKRKKRKGKSKAQGSRTEFG